MAVSISSPSDLDGLRSVQQFQIEDAFNLSLSQGHTASLVLAGNIAGNKDSIIISCLGYIQAAGCVPVKDGLDHLPETVLQVSLCFSVLCHKAQHTQGWEIPMKESQRGSTEGL